MAVIAGTEGNDSGATALTGTEFDDTISGLGGDGEIFGLAGNDTIDGGAGNDFIEGGSGNDTITDSDGDNESRAGSRATDCRNGVLKGVSAPEYVHVGWPVSAAPVVNLNEWRICLAAIPL